MKMKFCLLLMTSLLLNPLANADSITTGNGGNINMDWMNKVINKTPANPGSCPSLEVDTYRDGFKVARQRSFWGSYGVSASKWFPKDELWASVGVSPLKNSFGILSSNVDTLEQVDQTAAKKLPYEASEVANWRISDSAYWESQGGVSFYVGAGIDPVQVGIFAVATGGWVNYLEKTGNTKVYVERAHKNIKSVAFSAGISFPNFSVEKIVEDSTGYSYEFNLDQPSTVEAFERFMAGDTTKAQELTKIKNSGVTKISDTLGRRQAFSKNFGVSTPIIPLISFKMKSEQSFDHSEETSVWDEKISKDYGMYVKQRSTRILGLHRQVVRSFMGGKSVKDLPNFETENTRSVTENLFGTFKYSYQSDFGQEHRLRSYISQVSQLTGLDRETCVSVPSLQNTLGFNQVVLEVKWKDAYVREILGLGRTPGVLNKVKALALSYEAKRSAQDNCSQYSNFYGADSYDNNCDSNSDVAVSAVFAKLNGYAKTLKTSYTTDKKLFAQTMAKFGQEIWKSPFAFKAFFEVGKACGQDFTFEVSGQRITQHLNAQKFEYSEACGQ